MPSPTHTSCTPAIVGRPRSCTCSLMPPDTCLPSTHNVCPYIPVSCVWRCWAPAPTNYPPCFVSLTRAAFVHALLVHTLHRHGAMLFLETLHRVFTGERKRWIGMIVISEIKLWEETREVTGEEDKNIATHFHLLLLGLDYYLVRYCSNLGTVRQFSFTWALISISSSILYGVNYLMMMS